MKNKVNQDDTQSNTKDEESLGVPQGLLIPFQLIGEKLSEVDEFISAQATAFDPGVEGYISYIC